MAAIAVPHMAIKGRQRRTLDWVPHPAVSVQDQTFTAGFDSLQLCL